jgi:hypothetical protein
MLPNRCYGLDPEFSEFFFCSMARKRTLSQKSFLLPSDPTFLNGNKGHDYLKKKNLSVLFDAIKDIHLSNTNESQQHKRQSNGQSHNELNSTTPFHSLIHVDDLFNDLVIKRTVTVETNIPSNNLMCSLRKYVSNTLDERDLAIDSHKLYLHSKLWKFPNEIQINHLISLQQQTNSLLMLPKYSSSSSHFHILDNVWKISKCTSQNPNQQSYSMIIQEYLVLWQEALYSACELYFDHLIPTIHLIGSSPSSCRVIFSQSLSDSDSSPHQYEVLISCCPRSLYLKLRDAGIEITTLLQNSSSTSTSFSSEPISLPISHLSEKILTIRGLVSVRLFLDLFVSHSLSLHSISSYHRVVENLPLILSSRYFLHSSLQVNSLDSYSLTSDDAVESRDNNHTPPPLTSHPLDLFPQQTIKRIQLSGLFSSSSIKLLCHLLKKITLQHNHDIATPPALLLPPPSSHSTLSLSSIIDPRVLQLRKQANDPNGTEFGKNNLLLDELETSSTGIKLLNPFEITKSDPIDSALPIALPRSPRSPRPGLGSHSVKVPETPGIGAAVGGRGTIASEQKFFHLKLFSLQSDHIFNYALHRERGGGESSSEGEERRGSLMTDIHWQHHASQYEIEIWNLTRCQSHRVEYQMNRNSEEIILN